MPWCPECGTEHREGFTVCTDCHVPLVDTPPERKKEIVHDIQARETLLTVVRDDVEFTRVESLMAEAGIPVLKKHRGSGEYLEIYMGVSPYGIEVYVPFDALTRARALLSGDESVLEHGEGIPDAPEAQFPQEVPDTVLDPHEEQELHQYLRAVNQDMYRKKQAIATVILISILSGLAWSIFSLLKELF